MCTAASPIFWRYCQVSAALPEQKSERRAQKPARHPRVRAEFARCIGTVDCPADALLEPGGYWR